MRPGNGVLATLLGVALAAGARGSSHPIPERPGSRGEGAGAVPLLRMAPGSPFRTGAGPTALVLADLNGDGRLDLLTADSGANVLTLLHGDGRGGFAPADGSPLAAGHAPHQVAAGDIDGDGKVDLAVTEHDSQEIRILLGQSGGRFVPRRGPPILALQEGTAHNHGLALADVNGDGKLDLTTANQNQGSITILVGDGRGGFTAAPGSPVPTGGAPYPHVLVDLDGDGRIDIVAPNVHGDSVAILLGDGRGAFVPAPNSPRRVAPRPYSVAAGDLNGDHRIDLVVGHDDITRLTVLLGDGKGGFADAPGSPVDLGLRIGSVRLADFDADGRLDVAAPGGSDLVVLTGDGSGRLRPAPGSPYRIGRGSWSLAVADLNGDGRPDVAATALEENLVAVLFARP